MGGRSDEPDTASDLAAASDASLSHANPRSTRLAHARALLKQATEQPPAQRAKRTSASFESPSTSAPRRARPAPPPFTDPFEDADPFEPFEQCAPAEAPPAAADEAVFTRTSQRTRKTSVAEASDPRRPKRSLKGRALAALSRREFSRAELSRKLSPYVSGTDSLDTVLDDLERDGWLSNERFVESVVHRRAARMGGSRIISELKRHAVGESLISETADKLAQTETDRARAVWEKKYGTLPDTPAERARQARFLAARGFSGGTIGKILKGGDEDWSEEIVDD
ncbi:recombination regulator RecX [Caballeronia sp. LZ032]|nr:recombination regulator RecX [Caballeronia sp. LZ032]